MDRYTVSAHMRPGNDDYDDFASDRHTGLTLYVVLAGGVGLLAFLGWLLTL
jgi:hypothetical protein